MKDTWGENMALMVSATGNISSAIFNLSCVVLISIMFTNLFIGIICAAFSRHASIDDRFREIEQRLVAHSIIRKMFLRFRFMTRMHGAAREYRAANGLTPARRSVLRRSVGAPPAAAVVSDFGSGDVQQLVVTQPNQPVAAASLDETSFL